MLWASGKDYADGTSMSVMYLSTGSEWCFALGDFFWGGGQITRIVDVSRVYLMNEMSK